MNMLKLAVKQLGNEIDFKKRKTYSDLDIINYMIMIKKHRDYLIRAKAIAKAKRKNNV